MALRNKIMTSIINQCDYYGNIKERESYIKNWVNKPSITYSPNRRCMRLKQLRSMDQPIYRDNRMDKIYDYNINQPLEGRSPFNGKGDMTTGISRYENFDNLSNNNIIYLLVLVILILLFIKYY